MKDSIDLNENEFSRFFWLFTLAAREIPGMKNKNRYSETSVVT